MWLVTVVVLVLPSRDPGSLGSWAGITGAVLAYTLLSGAFLVSSRRIVRAAVQVASGAVLALGVVLAGAWLATPARVTGEAYLLLIGLALAADGSMGLLAARRRA